jgi:hypothetical protein
MKRLALVLMFLTGCSTLPYTIKDVNVGDKLEYRAEDNDDAREIKSKECSLEVSNILTIILGNGVPYEVIPMVCGYMTCKVASGNRDYQCWSFEAFKMSRMERQMREPPTP